MGRSAKFTKRPSKQAKAASKTAKEARKPLPPAPPPAPAEEKDGEGGEGKGPKKRRMMRAKVDKVSPVAGVGVSPTFYGDDVLSMEAGIERGSVRMAWVEKRNHLATQLSVGRRDTPILSLFLTSIHTVWRLLRAHDRWFNAIPIASVEIEADLTETRESLIFYRCRSSSSSLLQRISDPVRL